MTKTVTPTELRKDLFNLLDHVLDTGESLTIVRGDYELTLVSNSPAKRRRMWEKPPGFKSALAPGVTFEDLDATVAWEWNPDEKFGPPIAAEPPVKDLKR